MAHDSLGLRIVCPSRLGSSLLLALFFCSVLACGGRVGENASDGGTLIDGSSGTSSGSSGGSSGASGSGSSGSTGSGPSGGESSSSSGGGSSGSSGGTLSCPATPPTGSCSLASTVCRYYASDGETDCGCIAGQWQCYSGCSGTATRDMNVDPAVCAPQLRSTTSCNPVSVCGFTIAIPCWGDAGMPLGELDAGLDQCTAWCKSVAPPGWPPPIVCGRLDLEDGGSDGAVSLIGYCGGCGG